VWVWNPLVLDTVSTHFVSLATVSMSPRSVTRLFLQNLWRIWQENHKGIEYNDTRGLWGEDCVLHSIHRLGRIYCLISLGWQLNTIIQQLGVLLDDNRGGRSNLSRDNYFRMLNTLCHIVKLKRRTDRLVLVQKCALTLLSSYCEACSVCLKGIDGGRYWRLAWVCTWSGQAVQN
jgi:hypothetical protein